VLQVAGGSPEKIRFTLPPDNAVIAVEAQEASDALRHVIMIDMQGLLLRWLPAHRAAPTLELEHHLVLVQANAVLGPQVSVPLLLRWGHSTGGQI
jgi:hypothetical protein